jgi:hypothetical protein
METKPESQDGAWEGEGPQSSGASPTVTCEFESQPERCMFPECPCASVPLLNVAPGGKPTTLGIDLGAEDDTDDIVALGVKPEPEPRQPKRDRAKYMRDYRARRNQARTQ